ncbi:hypothetical protein BWGOE4_16940 [Bacillus mycoides]|uniref:Peptidase metallopeptidase domain-containing protein n=1 Tax=Bacillus cereus TaxID=1396 RepID=A0A1S9V882_BACCE|nr:MULTISPECIES: matrixin family metalloprotease [Bacillus]EJV59055.1 hypothetical protein IEM_04238 [Bacillus cereus BAG6O-2]MBM6647008.1 matrixin family metalloprotease [Bacillus sp. RIT 809]OFD45842.1 hypothetical protein BWGOE2_10680 [Bacillus mycoides]OFD48947.1 hypothetical protein BWGOE1_11170 [Bacillus mycoides]OFD64754.1 hypothetical protein BWGOE4_16940 [Bacillus mycoides]
MRNSKKIIFSLLGLLLFATVLPSSIKAYTHNGSKISNPNNAYYWIHGEFSKYGLKGEVLRGITAWNPSSKIQFTKESSLPGGANVKIEYVDRYNGDTYGIFRGSGNVTLFKKWRVELDSARRKETAVHEVGHALGLGHTQKSNDSISVMRQYEFNYKDYPQSDDWAGINARY